MSIRKVPILLLFAACAQNPTDPPTEATARVAPRPEVEARVKQNGTISCDHRGMTCWPWLGGDNECEVACGPGYYCIWYEPEETDWCIRHPGQNYRGNPAKPCTKGGDAWWNTYCVPSFAK